MLGCQETEGDSANPGKPVNYRTWGQLLEPGTGINVPGDGWPFRVSEIRTKQTASANRSRCGEN